MAPATSTATSQAAEEPNAVLNKAISETFRELRQWTESHGPLHREKGANMRGGVDIIDHSDPLRPLSRLGVIWIAVEKLKQLDRLLESASRQQVGKLHLVPEYSSPTEKPEAKPRPSTVVTPQVGHALHTGQAARTVQAAQTSTCKRGAIVITDLTERSQPSDTILVSKDYLFRLERENHLLRTHLLHFERGIVDRLENGLKHLVWRHSSSTTTQNNAQGGKADKEDTARVQREGPTERGNSRQPMPAPGEKRSLKLILKVGTRTLKGIGDGAEKQQVQGVAGTKRARKDSDKSGVGSSDIPLIRTGAIEGTAKVRRLK